LSKKFFFNNEFLNEKNPIYDNINRSWGIGNKFLSLLATRLEKNAIDFKKISIEDLNRQQWLVVSRMFRGVLPKRGSLKRRHIANIYFLDIISSYRGWRHANGLPTRGQRTWTNSWSAYNSNTTLRSLKVRLGRKYYGNLPTSELQTAILAEQVNLVYKIQWHSEWAAAKKDRVFLEGKGIRSKIDLYSMSNNQVMNPDKYKTMTKKQKQSFKKNHFSLGFDPGFTRPLMRDLFKARAGTPVELSIARSKLILNRNDSQFRYKPPKKKRWKG